MEKARKLCREEIQANPLLRDLLERTKAGRFVISYEGRTVILQPVEDITHTFTPDQLKEFAQAYAEADDPQQRLSGDQLLKLVEQELENG